MKIPCWYSQQCCSVQASGHTDYFPIFPRVHLFNICSSCLIALCSVGFAATNTRGGTAAEKEAMPPWAMRPDGCGKTNNVPSSLFFSSCDPQQVGALFLLQPNSPLSPQGHVHAQSKTQGGLAIGEGLVMHFLPSTPRCSPRQAVNLK